MSLVSNEVLDLLSRITGQKLNHRDVTPPVIFLANLVTILLGVIFVDGKVAQEEKQRLLETLYKFSTPESDVRRLTHLMIKSIKENQLYRKSNAWLKLIAPLTESQKLLLISFGYEIAAADEEMDPREKKYLQILGKRLSLNPHHLEVLEAVFTHQENQDSAALEKIHFLLDPVRFQELDAVFVKAARDMLAILPALPEKKLTHQELVISYGELKKFQEHRHRLNDCCEKIFRIVQDCQEHGFLPQTFIKDAKEVWEKNQSQRFRVAVVGEFSQGKSTLLNALLGEEIQPAREIPCSGTVTVLKYGKQKRVVCLYKDGREEEISFEKYQDKASISEDAAIDCLSDELAQSQIEEIIFEHPDLELCRSGVEIVDSPGLNEHPERTAITQKLLKNTDAAIFLTNASRPLTQGERDLLHEVKLHLNGGKGDNPANNLFVACNFMDLIRSTKGQEQVKQRVTKFVQGDDPIITGENRIHFISAQAALDAILTGNKDNYLEDFLRLTSSIEKFLIFERGTLTIQCSVNNINDLIQKSFDGLIQAQNMLEGKIKISEAEKQKIFEQIGEASGRDVKIRIIAEQLMTQVVEKANESWDKWIEELDEILSLKSYEWESEHSGIWSRDRLVKDYAHQFNKDLSEELDAWINEQLKKNILREPLELLDRAIEIELESINHEFQEFNTSQETESNSWQFLNETQNDLNSISNSGFWGGFGAISIGAALVPVMFMAGPILAVVAGLGAGLFGGGGVAIIEESLSLKKKVVELGCEKFIESIDNIFEKLDEMIASVFYERVEIASNAIEKTISLYENLLEQQEKAHQGTLEKREADKAWISQKRQELEQVHKDIQSVIKL